MSVRRFELRMSNGVVAAEASSRAERRDEMLSRDHSNIRALYRKAWEHLRLLRRSCDEIEPESTPILAFGRFKKARVITAGLNPSEDEFRTTLKAGRKPLKEIERRFLHWPASGRLTQKRLYEALQKSERYFEKGGNAYEWFDKTVRSLPTYVTGSSN